MKRACMIHDQVNLILLPILGIATAAGLLGYVDPVKVTILFTWYIVADFTWVVVEPHAVPSLPNVILLHHFVTFVLLCFPLRYAHLAKYTCWDGICEINTFFLIARRQWRSLGKPFTILYWITFFPMRIFLYPYALIKFWEEMYYDGRYQAWEIGSVLGSQIILIGFNVLLLSLTASNWHKKRVTRRKASSEKKEIANEFVSNDKNMTSNIGNRNLQASGNDIKKRSSHRSEITATALQD